MENWSTKWVKTASVENWDAQYLNQLKYQLLDTAVFNKLLLGIMSSHKAIYNRA